MNAELTAPQRRTDAVIRRPGWHRQLRARLTAARLDRDLDAGRAVIPGSALAAHAERIVAAAERQRLAGGLQSVLVRARNAGPAESSRIALQRRRVLADEALIGQILHRLGAPQPVRPRGIARLRLMLRDGAGLTGPGSAAAALRGALAAL
jgi:hypothetical protein